MLRKYIVTSHITHDGKGYPEGSTIELTEDQAKGKHVEPLPEPEPKKKPAKD